MSTRDETNRRVRDRCKKPCVDGCGRLAWHKGGSGRCPICAGRLRRGNGAGGRRPRPALERFLGHTVPEPNTGCWLWLSGYDKDGYAQFFEARGPGHEQRGHRYAYKTFVGPVPDGLVLDHLCRNRGCVNPAHLEAVTNRENILRGRSPGTERTHCKNGHEFTHANTYARPGTRARVCRTCHCESERVRRPLRRALKAAA